jgi:Leucine-rich repeat (LRR) protein
MNKKITYHLLVILLFCCGKISQAQVVIPDPNFRQFLIDNYPSVMKPDQTLKPSAAAAITSQFKCYGANVSDLTGIEYFTGITSLEVKYNPNLQTIPDISGLTSLTILGLDSNALTDIPSLSTLTQLRIISFHHNQVRTLPSVAGLNQLTDIQVHNNQLTSLPDLTDQVNLQRLFCSYNPITSLPSLSTLTNLDMIVCQNTQITSIPDLNNCTSLEYLVCSGSPVSVLPPINNCLLLKELKVFNCNLTALPDLSIYPGLYSVKVFGNLLSFEDLLPVTTCALYNTTDFVLVPQQDLGTAQTITAQELSPATIDLGIDASVSSNTYTWYKNNTFYQTTTESKLHFNSLRSFDAGSYYCTITNSSPTLAGMTLKSVAVMLTTTTATEDPVFYPNGDGIADTYYIKDSGMASIYNREGELVRKLPIPAHWDGIKSNGQEAPSGLYVIDINGNSSVRVTLIR